MTDERGIPVFTEEQIETAIRNGVSLEEFASGMIDEDGDFTDEAEEEMPVEEFDDERDPEERADGYDIDENTGYVSCECRMFPCVHNNPR